MHLSKSLFIALTLSLSLPSFAQEEEDKPGTTVVGRKPNSTLSLGVGTGFNIWASDLYSSIYDFDSGYADYASDNSEVADTCSAAKEELQKEAEEAENEQIVVVGEIHGDIDSQYPEIIDSFLPNGGCLAIEASSAEEVAASTHSGFSLAASHAKSRGISVHYVDTDTQLDRETQAVFDLAWLSEEDKQTIADELSGNFDSLNLRDAVMARNLNALRSTCRKILSLNGIAHISKQIDYGPGRVNLIDQIPDAQPVDATNLNSCEGK